MPARWTLHHKLAFMIGLATLPSLVAGAILGTLAYEAEGRLAREHLESLARWGAADFYFANRQHGLRAADLALTRAVANRAPLPAGSVIAMLGPAGDLQFRKPSLPAWRGRVMLPPGDWRLQAQWGTFEQRFLTDHVLRVSGFARTPDGRFVIVSMPARSVYAPAHEFTAIVLLGSFLGAGIGLLLALYYAERLIRFMKAMARALASWGEEGTCQLLEAPDDEVGDLIRASATLASRLEQARAEELARLVSERTAELQAAYDELKALEGLKGDFLNAVSHELRTPLTAIRGYAEFLEDEIGGELTPQQRAFVENIRQGIDQLAFLVNDLLDFGRLEAGQFHLTCHHFDYLALLDSAVRQVQSVADRKGIRLELDAPPLPEINADPRRTLQVLHNLLGNALKFTPDGGTILLRARPHPDGVLTEVVDTGIGIAQEHQDRLFTKFYQVDSSLTREVRGTGLGLAICKGLVEAMEGTIGMESTPGRGSRFWFVLPTASATPEQLRIALIP